MKKLIMPGFLILGVFFLAGCGQKQANHEKKEIPTVCAKEGERVSVQGQPDNCCEGLKQVGDCKDGWEGNCSTPCPPGGITKCTNCGDGVCNAELEGKCNCPEDCK